MNRQRCRGIAIPAADVAPVKSDKDLTFTEMRAFTLDRGEYFMDPCVIHEVIIQNMRTIYKQSG